MSFSVQSTSAGTVHQADQPPVISVLLPVYNAERFIREAVDSVLAQTRGNFELLALDDGSTDNSLRILREYEAKDRRVQVFSQENRGVSSAMNELIGMARGLYLARMDADDICSPTRLEKQAQFLDSSTQHVAVGGWAEHMNVNCRPIGIVETPLNHEEIDQAHLKGHCSIWHPSALMRAAAVSRVGGYDPNFVHAEDLDLWLRLARCGRLANLPFVAVRIRLHRNGMSERQRDLQRTFARLACEKAWRQRGIAGTFEATEHWRPGRDRQSRHHFALKNGWVAWSHTHRDTWWSYTLEAIRLRPFALSSWNLFFFGLLKRPRGLAKPCE